MITKLLAIAFLALPLWGAEVTVAADGSGQFKTIQAAVDAAPSGSRVRFTIRIAPGRYEERVVVPSEKTFVAFVGTNPMTTVITAASHAGLPGPDGKPINTFATPTVFVQANDFLAENITFDNAAGPHGQAVALTIMGDRGVFRNCRFLGYQDTLLAQAGRHYFAKCYIEGATDFIFGGSAAWFEDCTIHVTANGYITAANTTKDQKYGYVFHNCKITGEAGVRTVLGRPWRPYAATVFLNTTMTDVVRAEGWNNWNDPTREKTVRYAEYGSGGAGRVAWAKKLTTPESSQFTLANVLGGLDGWNPKTASVKTAVRVTRANGPVKGAAIPKGFVWIATALDGRVASSPDGLTWSLIEGGVAAAPKGFYDEAAAQYVVLSSTTLPKNAIQAFQEDTENNPRIWYATTKDHVSFSEPKLLFDNNYAVREAQIVKMGSRYVLVHSDSTWPVHALRAAWSSSPHGPWGPSTDAFTPKGTERPVAMNGMVYFTNTNTHAAGLMLTSEFLTFTDASESLHFPAGFLPRSMYQAPIAETKPAPIAPKPLFRDPVHDGAADPVLVWNRAEKQWWMFYTNRRANMPELKGVSWVHGTRIGIATSSDAGATWKYQGTAEIPYGTADYTHWAPEIVDFGGVYHMYLSIVPGVYETWNAAREIIHLTSKDLRKWEFQSKLDLGSDRVIDANVTRLPDGSWRMWYKDERAKDGSLYYADSSDLYHWKSKGNAIKGVGGEGPKIFPWKGAYWAIVDVWDGLAVFRSTDCLTWARQTPNILKEPGTIATDDSKGSHADVVVSADRAWLFYFVHQRGDVEMQKHTVLQVVELQYKDGALAADRNAPARIQLMPRN